MAFQRVERFAFDRVFSTSLKKESSIARSVQADLDTLRVELRILQASRAEQLAAARAEGVEAGLAQARAEYDVALLSAVDSLQAGIEAIDARFDEVSARITGEAAEVALAAADMIAGRALEHAPDAAIDAAIGRALAQVARGTELRVRVHPELVEAIEAKIAQRQAQDRRRLNLTVLSDPTVAPGDARIVWEEGTLALDAESRRSAVLSELESLLPR
ncbi:FliH/SctL family protein [uncultured Sphingomonas sp.]|uniref:FliH/SctL family protein n=1 Tax=uncultured Sphingomonas sp. TaxID=158754 RepID=UPI00260801FD|nr:FliH/SctL family protein [uncultured Sphingomonas sp.]